VAALITTEKEFNMRISVNHRKTHIYRVDIIHDRLSDLAMQILEFDGSARAPWTRDLTYALKRCPEYMEKRYRRLCKIQALYRSAYLFDRD
jgi:hypothetical protein